MRDNLFNALITMLRSLSFFQSETGVIRVYDYPITAPDGYPYVVVGSGSLESEVLDNARDSRRYSYNVQIVGEKFGDVAGLSQSNALQAMRSIEDQVVAAIDSNYFLGLSGQVVRSFPTQGFWGLTDNNSRVVLNLTIKVDTMANITG